jgi:hypothetical protein
VWEFEDIGPMKSLVRPSFFRVFDLLLSTTNPGMKLARWTYDGVEFERERHSFTGPNHGLAVDIVTLTRPGRRGWKLMVTKEYWWAGTESKPLKNLHWARATAGQRNDVLAWMRAQETALERPRPQQRGSDTRSRVEFELDAMDEAGLAGRNESEP